MWQSLFGEADRRIRMGRILGLVFITAGFIVIGKAWDGAANNFRVDAQFPYLLSGGFMGLALVITGSVLLILATIRAEREVLTNKFEEMSTLLGRNLARLGFSSNGSTASKEQVIAGSSTYHRADCRVLEGKPGLTLVSVEQAVAEGLTPCRVCDPPAAPAETPAEVSSGAETPAQ